MVGMPYFLKVIGKLVGKFFDGLASDDFFTWLFAMSISAIVIYVVLLV